MFLPRRFLLACIAALVVAGPARAAPAELKVFVSGAFAPAFDKLAPEYERRNGVRIAIGHGPSMGETPNAIPNRLDRREEADVVIMAREALDRLAASGKVAPGSERDLVVSKIAVAVKAGAPALDISTSQAVRTALLTAGSVAYSDSASGVYISTQMFAKLGIVNAMAGKARMIPATPVGLIVARGEAEIGFQQFSELIAVEGIRIVGFLPDDIQKVTRFSAGLVAYSTKGAEGKKLIDFLRSDAALAVITDSGLEPAPSGP